VHSQKQEKEEEIIMNSQACIKSLSFSNCMIAEYGPNSSRHNYSYIGVSLCTKLPRVSKSQEEITARF
jgi:hypothetical protein